VNVKDENVEEKITFLKKIPLTFKLRQVVVIEHNREELILFLCQTAFYWKCLKTLKKCVISSADCE
jgi:hypothetical protein